MPLSSNGRTTSEEHRRSGSLLLDLLICLRPYQWVKNGIVFGGLVFSHSMMEGRAVQLSVMAFVVFCLASSGIYILNDLHDLKEDRQHPAKRLRPIAAGRLNSGLAGIVCLLLLGISVWAGLKIQTGFGGVLIAYVVLNLAYTFALKYAMVVDVMAVAVGYVLRAVAGAVVIGVTASPWLILCTLMLAVLIGFGKRRGELTLLQEGAENHRRSLKGYSVPLLDLMMAIAAASVVMTYALYTLATETTARFGTSGLVLTAPSVMYGVFRYLYLVQKRNEGGDPSRLLMTDLPTLINVAIWFVIVCFIVYGPRSWLPW